MPFRVVSDGPTVTVEHRYAHDPIAEAKLGFGIKDLGPESLEKLDALSTDLKLQYPEAEPSKADSNGDANGVVLKSSDGRQRVVATLGGMMFTREAPYDCWDAFSGQARQAWDAYCNAVGPTDVESFMLHYSNELQIPLGVPLHVFFNVYPAIPDRNLLFNQFFLLSQTNVSPPPGNLLTIMRPKFEGTAKSVDSGSILIGLDNIFTFRVRNEENVWENMAQFRKIKNDTFESQITEAMRAMIR